jgi:hypothetical protein
MPGKTARGSSQITDGFARNADALASLTNYPLKLSRTDSLNPRLQHSSLMAAGISYFLSLYRAPHHEPVPGSVDGCF